MGDPETALDGNSSQQTLRMAQGASFTKERTGGATIRVTDFMMDYFESVDAGLRLAFMGEPTRVIWAAITDSEVQAELENKLETAAATSRLTSGTPLVWLIRLAATAFRVTSPLLVHRPDLVQHQDLQGSVRRQQPASDGIDGGHCRARAMKLLMSGRFSSSMRTRFSHATVLLDRDHPARLTGRSPLPMMTASPTSGCGQVQRGDVPGCRQVVRRLAGSGGWGSHPAKRKAREGLRAIRGACRRHPVFDCLTSSSWQVLCCPRQA